MTFLTILLSAFLVQTPDTTTHKPDSMRLREINEVTVYSIAPNKIGLPYIAVDKKEIEKQK